MMLSWGCCHLRLWGNVSCEVLLFCRLVVDCLSFPFLLLILEVCWLVLCWPWWIFTIIQLSNDKKSWLEHSRKSRGEHTHKDEDVCRSNSCLGLQSLRYRGQRWVAFFWSSKFRMQRPRGWVEITDSGLSDDVGKSWNWFEQRSVHLLFFAD